MSVGDALHNDKEKNMNEKKLSGAAKIAADKKAAKLAAEAPTNTTAQADNNITLQTFAAPRVPKEIKLIFSPNSARVIPWENGITTRVAMAKAGFEVKESNSEQIVKYTIRLNNIAMLDLDTPIPEPNGTTVSFVLVTEEIKGN